MAARLFNLLLCALLAGPLSLSAWAVARPENRVGGSPVFSSDFASQETAKPIVASGENPGCGYDFASGVHKYLYAQDNPVDMDDPSGNASSFTPVQAAAIGRQVHEIIGRDFQAPPTRITSQSVFTILGLPNPVKKLGQKLGRIFPDLVDFQKHEVYEIKPMSIAGTAAGFAQLYGYITLFNKLDPAGHWHDGNSYDYNKGEITLGNPLCVVVVAPTVSGMIYYEPFTIQQLGKAGARVTARLDTARLQQMVGVASLLELMGGI